MTEEQKKTIPGNPADTVRAFEAIVGALEPFAQMDRARLLAAACIVSMHEVAAEKLVLTSIRRAP